MNRQRLILLASTLLLFVGVSWFYQNYNTASKGSQTDVTESQSTNKEFFFDNGITASPLANVEVSFQKVIFDPNNSKTITFENGSSLEIPAGIFIDKNGQPVKQLVELNYREFHDAKDLIVSGIPMRVKNENNEEDWMQTAGMFEIRGYSAGEPVFVADGKSIQVNMVSNVGGEYPFWYFDEAASNWKQIGSADAKPNTASATQTAQTQATPPVKPAPYDPSLAINFNIDYSSFPELKEYQHTIWQFADEDASKQPNKNKWINKEEWIEASVKATGQADLYQLTLTSDTAVYAVKVRPALKGDDYEAAMAAYRKKIQLYESVKNEQSARSKAQEYIRNYRVSGFGIYNYDIIYKSEDRVPLIANFEFDDPTLGHDFIKKNIVVFLVTANSKTVISYDYDTWQNFSINPYDDNQLIAILLGNLIATMSHQEFVSQRNQIREAVGKSYTFQLTINPKAITSLEDLNSMVL